MNNQVRFFKINVAHNTFAYIKAGQTKFLILTESGMSPHKGQLSVENQGGKPYLKAQINGGPLEWYELWSEITEIEWEVEFQAFCQEA